MAYGTVFSVREYRWHRSYVATGQDHTRVPSCSLALAHGRNPGRYRDYGLLPWSEELSKVCRTSADGVNAAEPLTNGMVDLWFVVSRRRTPSTRAVAPPRYLPGVMCWICKEHNVSVLRSRLRPGRWQLPLPRSNNFQQLHAPGKETLRGWCCLFVCL